MPDPAYFAVLLCLISPFVGSFLCVLIDRLPRGESVVWPGSACRTCGRRLRPRDLMPVLSFALSRGRCRHCGAAIPSWHLYVEITATGAGVVAAILGTTPVGMGLIALILWLLLALAVTDLLWFRLPDLLTGGLLAAALGWALGPGGAAVTPGAALVGAALGAGSFLGLRLGYRALRGREGLGLGDVKMMAGLGALVGPWDVPLLVLVAALAGLAATAGATVQGGWTATRALPFGACLAAAAALVWLAGLVPN